MLQSPVALLPWILGLVGLVAGGFGASVAPIPQVPDLQQPLLQGLDEHGRAGLLALFETGHTEDDVVRLGVVADSIAIGNHRTIDRKSVV